MAAKQPQQELHENLVVLLQHLFHQKFCPAEEIDAQKRAHIMPVYFYGWLDKHMNMMNAEEECAAAGVSLDTWHVLEEIVNSGVAVERTFQVWYTVVLAHRPQPKVDLERCTVTMQLHYADGTITPIQVMLDRRLIEGPGFTDGLIAAQLTRHMQAFISEILESGLDGLRKKGKNYRGGTPEDPFEVMMGLMLKHMIPKLQPEYRQPVEDYVRYAQAILRPVVPPEMIAHFEREKAKSEPQPEGPARGGWDV